MTPLCARSPRLHLNLRLAESHPHRVVDAGWRVRHALAAQRTAAPLRNVLKSRPSREGERTAKAPNQEAKDGRWFVHASIPSPRAVPSGSRSTAGSGPRMSRSRRGGPPENVSVVRERGAKPFDPVAGPSAAGRTVAADDRSPALGPRAGGGSHARAPIRSCTRRSRRP